MGLVQLQEALGEKNWGRCQLNITEPWHPILIIMMAICKRPQSSWHALIVNFARHKYKAYGL